MIDGDVETYSSLRMSSLILEEAHEAIVGTFIMLEEHKASLEEP